MESPNTLDQTLISVEAGLGFEAAMARAGQNGKGPLAQNTFARSKICRLVEAARIPIWPWQKGPMFRTSGALFGPWCRQTRTELRWQASSEPRQSR